MPIFPVESMRSLSFPAVSTVTVSLAVNLIAVSVSPMCLILSAISKLPLTVRSLVNDPVIPDISDSARVPLRVPA